MMKLKAILIVLASCWPTLAFPVLLKGNRPHKLFATIPSLQEQNREEQGKTLEFYEDSQQSGIPGITLPSQGSGIVSSITGLEIPITANEINERLARALEKMAQKDLSSKRVDAENVQILYEDDAIVVVDKPAGTLTVPGKKKTLNSFVTAVFDRTGCSLTDPDRMVVHRLGMDTSGVMVFCKTMDAVRGLNTAFRIQEVSRQYEALVMGHLEYDEGYIDLPLMRDYERPPYQRISTRNHQIVLAEFTKMDIPQKLLEMPKESVTRYEVIAREEVGDSEKYAVTRVLLTSLTGRTHQLNVHMAAFGHPIVGDSVYGINGEALEDGGLSEAEAEELAWNPSRSSRSDQEAVSRIYQGKQMCVHAKSITFPHPTTQEELTFETPAPF